jgi:hypothetical protein
LRNAQGIGGATQGGTPQSPVSGRAGNAPKLMETLGKHRFMRMSTLLTHLRNEMSSLLGATMIGLKLISVALEIPGAVQTLPANQRMYIAEKIIGFLRKE